MNSYIFARVFAGSELEIGSPVSHSELLVIAPPAHPHKSFFTVLNYISLSPATYIFKSISMDIAFL